MPGVRRAVREIAGERGAKVPRVLPVARSVNGVAGLGGLPSLRWNVPKAHAIAHSEI